MTAAYCRDETEAMNELLGRPPCRTPSATWCWRGLPNSSPACAPRPASNRAVESFMREYDLSSEEGVLLMCVAEALLRIPDTATADKLIRDKLGEADWRSTSAPATPSSSTPRPGA
jgi:RHH-type proline utilization regulon transcriptional repressor/proline dehydrogenase/delta 1-pyrroline-5-carboxylate dehydrogenase